MSANGSQFLNNHNIREVIERTSLEGDTSELSDILFETVQHNRVDVVDMIMNTQWLVRQSFGIVQSALTQFYADRSRGRSRILPSAAVIGFHNQKLVHRIAKFLVCPKIVGDVADEVGDQLHLIR